MLGAAAKAKKEKKVKGPKPWSWEKIQEEASGSEEGQTEPTYKTSSDQVVFPVTTSQGSQIQPAPFTNTGPYRPPTGRLVIPFTTTPQQPLTAGFNIDFKTLAILAGAAVLIYFIVKD